MIHDISQKSHTKTIQSLRKLIQNHKQNLTQIRHIIIHISYSQSYKKITQNPTQYQTQNHAQILHKI